MLENILKNEDTVERSRRQRILKKVLKNKLVYVGIIGCLILVLISIFAPLLATHDPTEQNIIQRLAEPGGDHWFGTDAFGRDLYSRIIWATRSTVIIAISSIFLGMMAGSLIGILAGYKGGWIDTVVMEIINISMTFPTIVLGILILMVIGGGELNIILALGISFIARFARLARGETLKLKQAVYVKAAQAYGASDLLIILKHILPNISGTLIVSGALWTATAIRAEAGLSFLGLGVQPPAPSWGNLISEGLDKILDAYWLSMYPAIAIMIAVLSINMLGDGLRDFLDPKN